MMELSFLSFLLRVLLLRVFELRTEVKEHEGSTNKP